MKKYFVLLFLFLFFNSFILAQELSTSSEDQISISLTVYNLNIGLIKEIRQLKLPKGEFDLKFEDVPYQINPVTVHIKSITSPNAIFVLEQNYEYDLMSPSKLLDKYIGKELFLIHTDPKTKEEIREKAVLLSTNEGNIFKMDDRILIGHPGRIELPKLPENLISRPTLIWRLKNNFDGTQKIEASYLSNGINWKADYVLLLNKDDTKGDLTGWVTLDNRSGAGYKNASLKLIAGEIHRVEEEVVRGRELYRAEAKAVPQFEEKEFFEYHIYILERKTTIKNNQTKQITLLSSADIPLRKRFIFFGKNYYFLSSYSDFEKSEKVGVYIEIKNSKENNLGIALPKGIVRVYKEDHRGEIQFVGEDRIDHTPKDEKFKLKMGEAFDVVASRKQMDFKKIARNIYESSWEISIRNHKEEDVVVEVLEPMSGDWEVVEKNFEFKKEDARTILFSVPVKKNSESILKYRVRVKY
ncbi:MAG: DUF4139 domain-containing protein [Acidobacteriota bacterium]